MAYRYDNRGNIIRDNAGTRPTRTPTTTRIPTYGRTATTRSYASGTSTGGIVAGCIVSTLILVALVIGLIFSGFDGVFVLPSNLLGELFWAYWLVAVAATIIPPIAIGVKTEDFWAGLWTLCATVIANATGLVLSYLASQLRMLPAIVRYTANAEGLFTSTAGAVGGVMIILPYVVLGATLLSSFIFIIYRYGENDDIAPADIIWSFLCSIITPIAVLLAIALVMVAIAIVIGIVYLVLAILFALLQVIVVIIALFCFCCR